MAIVTDRKQIFLREIEALNHEKRQILEVKVKTRKLTFILIKLH